MKVDSSNSKLYISTQTNPLFLQVLIYEHHCILCGVDPENNYDKEQKAKDGIVFPPRRTLPVKRLRRRQPRGVPSKKPKDQDRWALAASF